PNKRPMLSDLRECVTGDTLVDLADGRRVPIADLVGTEPEVLAIDGAGKVVAARRDMVWSVGEREVFAARLASGRVRRTTAQHLWYGFDGWRRLADLRPGDRVAIAQEPARARAVSRGGAAAARGASGGGRAHCAFAPSRATVASRAAVLDDPGPRAI